MTMDYDEIVTCVEAALSDVLDRTVAGVPASTRLFDDLHLDSTTGLELLMAMEESAGLVVDPEQIDMADFETVATFAAFVQRELAGAAGEPEAASSGHRAG